MAFDFLVPVEDKVLAHCELLPEQALGKHVQIHTVRDGLPVLASSVYGHCRRKGIEKRF